MPNYNHPFCSGCPYHPLGPLALAPSLGRAHEPLDVDGAGARTLLIVQSPGIDEWEVGRPLWSRNRSSAARRVQLRMEASGRQRSDYDITNAVQCYPGKKPKVGDKAPRDNPPDALAVKKCGQWLQELLNKRRYDKIVAFGIPAQKALARCTIPDDTNVVRCKHPSGGLSNTMLDSALK